LHHATKQIHAPTADISNSALKSPEYPAGNRTAGWQKRCQIPNHLPPPGRSSTELPASGEDRDPQAGYPLAIKGILANLKTREPVEILEALQIGDTTVDPETGSKTRSLIRCADSSYSNLSPDTRSILLLLAPFTGVILANGLEEYVKIVGSQPELASIQTGDWKRVITTAKEWGMLSSAGTPGF
jgi:hypothetical protein